METIAAPWQELEGREVHGRYPLHRCLSEGDRQAVFETLYREKPAIIKLIRPDSSHTAYRLLAGIDAGKSLHHPNLLDIYDSGDIRMDDTRYVYAVMERADDNLGRVLRERSLEPDELRELLNGTLSALDFMHSEGFVYSNLRPTNILAVGDSLKLSSENVQAVDQARGFAQAPGIYDAPETGSGIHMTASDIYSLGILTLEAATGSPLQTDSTKVPAPFDAIVRGALVKDPEERWTSNQIRAALEGKHVPIPTPVSAPVKPAEIPMNRFSSFDEEPTPIYKRMRVLGIGAALAAGTICALLVQHAKQAPKTPVATPIANIAAPVVEAEAPAPSPKPTATAAANHKDRWAVVAATYNRQADADKRVHTLRKKHNSLHPQVLNNGGSRYFVVFGGATSEQQAKAMERRVKTKAGIRDAYVTRLD